MRCLGDADGSSVLGFLDSLSGRWARSSLFWVVWWSYLPLTRTPHKPLTCDFATP
jgi:hypothetical protein